MTSLSNATSGTYFYKTRFVNTPNLTSGGRSQAWMKLENYLRTKSIMMNPMMPQLFTNLPASERGDYIQTRLFPMALDLGNKHGDRAGKQMNDLARYAELSPADISHFINRLQRVAADEQAGRAKLASGEAFDKAVHHMLRYPNLSVAMLGSLVRQVNDPFWFSLSPSYEQTSLLMLVENPACPVEVAARVYQAHEALTAHRSKTAFAEAVAVQYPDLAGLPTDLQVTVVAGQPIPADWFVDVFPPTARRRPSSPVARGEAWTELVAAPEGRT